MIVDLEKNTASALIWPIGPAPFYTPPLAPIALNFPSGSIFNSESELLLCYDGQQHSTKCEIQNLDIIFDARGGDSAALGVLYGKHRSFFIFFLFCKIIY